MEKNLLEFAKPPVTNTKNSTSTLSAINKPWEVLVIDDDRSVHEVTKIVLSDYEFDNRKLNLTHGYSAAEAKLILQNKNDFAVLLLDVVMETDEAGLNLVNYIRNELKNQSIRIVLRTGQAGQAQESSVIIDYDINDYKGKAELTSQKMCSCITTALRSYRDIETIQHLAAIRLALQQQASSANEELGKVNNKLREEIQGRLQFQEQLQASNNQLESIINNSQATITLKNLDGEYVLVNELFVKGIDMEEKEVIGKTDRQLFPKEIAEFFEVTDYEVISKGEAMQSEQLLPTPEGDRSYLTVKFPLYDNDGEVNQICCINTDISDRIEAQNEILRLAKYDALTNLPNRELFVDRTTQAISRANWESKLTAVMFIDLDRFKVVNDTLGHDIGDELLIKVANRLSFCIREGDSASRFGGDEFAVLLVDVASEMDIVRVTEKIRCELAKPYNIEGKQLVVTPSIGVSRCPVDGGQAKILLKKADIAMYKAKKTTKNSYCFYSHEDDSRANELLSLELDLRSALEKAQLYLVYQPKINMRDGRMSGVEALLRWQHPTKGMITPFEFIPILEETGMIIEVGHWVIKEACLFAAHLSEQGLSFKVAVNLSSKQFLQVGLLDTLRESLKISQCPASLLEVELTEGALVDDVEHASKVLHDIADLGISLAIDDFGTGYSSMSYLKQFPFNTLKIDRSFIIDAPKLDQDKAIVTTIVQLAHNLGMTIVAEGVETKQQYDLLKSISPSINECQIQGNIFSRPLSPENFPQNDDEFVNLWRSINDDPPN